MTPIGGIMSHKLLVIDDNKGCCDLYKFRFEHDGWEVRIAYSAEKALEIFKDEEYLPDTILLDVMLPRMQGDELLSILKNDSKTKDIKIVMLLAVNFSSDDENSFTKKADDCILKIDLKPNELVERVTKLVEG